jgi:hypothetical protein
MDAKAKKRNNRRLTQMYCILWDSAAFDRSWVGLESI